MGKVESSILAYIRSRLTQGALSVSATEIMRAVVPPDHPEYQERPSYRFGLERLRRRKVINAVDALDGERHYFIGAYPSAELRRTAEFGCLPPLQG